MLDIDNGNIILNNNIIIKKNMTKKEFLDSELSNKIFNKVENTNSNYYLKPMLISEKYYMVSIYFNQYNKISFINLSYCKNESIPNWKEWNVEEEINKKRINDLFLKDILGEPPYCYNWGEVSSNFNKQSSTSYITISYF